MASETASQDLRHVRVISSVGKDALLFQNLRTTEQLGRLFLLELNALSTDFSLDFDALLGKQITIELVLGRSQNPRHFNGYVSKVTQGGQIGRFASYQIIIRPWLWFLTQTNDCRIFQNKSVPEIVTSVLRENNAADFKDSLSTAYPQREYVVQYCESDFNFIARLLESEGIYYFFEHTDNSHTMVLADDYNAHKSIKGDPNVPYFPPFDSDRRERDHVFGWSPTSEVRTGQVTLNDFDFVKPRLPNRRLRHTESITSAHDHGDYEVFDYPGNYFKTDDREHYSKRRIEELHATKSIVTGQGNVASLAAGYLFDLCDHPRNDQNAEYLIVSADYKISNNAYQTGTAGEGFDVDCEFQSINSKQPFRPARTTPKPVLNGPQSAIVTGPSGEEIWTDKHGRVKCQFHWDRYGSYDEKSSCWIRVSSIWAGKSWGGVAIPRIGQEVVVEFLDGDPDRPMITGRVYNGEQTPPYTLPEGKVFSGMKSNSTKGGNGYNEFVFDDTKGNELIRVHGQFDMDSTIENDLREHVLNNRSRDVAVDETIQIGNDRTESVGCNETTNIGSDRTEMVGANEIIAIALNRTHTIGANELMTVALNRGKKIGMSEKVDIGTSLSKDVGTSETKTVGSTQSLTVGSDQTTKIGSNRTLEVADDETVAIGKKRSHSVGEDDALDVGKTLSIVAGDEISLQTGQSSIVMKKDGTITIKGKNILAEGSTAINLKAAGNVVIKGKKILEN